MAGSSDQVFLRAFSWFKAAVDQLQTAIPPGGPVNLSGTLTDILRTKLGLELDKTAATIDPSAFSATRAEARSLATAAMVTGESLAALRILGEVLSNAGTATVGLDDLSKVVQQIDRITGASPGKPPSAYSIAKLLLILSGDSEEPDNKPPARKLILLLKNNQGLSDAQVLEPQMILGLAIMVVGTILDRSFAGAGLPAAPKESIPAPPADQRKAFTLARSDNASKKLDLTLGVSNPGPQAKLFAELSSTLSTPQSAGDAFELQFSSGANFRAQFSLPPLAPLPATIPPPEFHGDLDIGLTRSASSLSGWRRCRGAPA